MKTREGSSSGTGRSREAFPEASARPPADLGKARKKKKFRRRRADLRSILNVEGWSVSARPKPSARSWRKPPEKTGREKPAARRSFLGGVKLGVVMLCGLLSLLVAFDGWRNSDGVYGGVDVGGVGVGGESRQEAERTLDGGAARLPEEVTFVAGEKSVTLSAKELGISVDAPRSVDHAYAVGREGGFFGRAGDRLRSVFRAAEVKPEINYRKEAITDAFERETKEAGYKVSGGGAQAVSVVPGEEGEEIQATFWDGLEARLMQGEGRIEVPLRTIEPKLTTAEAESLRPTELLSTYTTNYLTYDDEAGRVSNLQTASDAVNGTVLAPGEVFSFNDLAEPLDYEESKVIVHGKVDYADGGGLCQVSSTLYMAANLAGLETVERHPHFAELPYIQPGFDATVWFGALDMKFENTSPGYLYIQQWVDTTTGDVHAAIYGRPSGVSASMDSERVAKYKDEKGDPVTKWVTYKTVTKDGEVVMDGPLHTDTYKQLGEAN